VLGLILLVVLAGPLALSGVIVLKRQPVEAAEAKSFASKRRVLEQDRLFRQEVAPELRQLAQRPGLPARRLEEVASDLERSSYDSAEWYDTVQLEDSDMATLKRYEDLVWERIRFLRDRASDAEVARAVGELEQAVDQRRDLLIRGRRAPAAPPSVLLRAGAPAQGVDALRGLALGDAVTSSDGTDALVEGVATYFAEGQTWKLVHLVPPGGEGQARWLYVGPQGMELALLDEVAAVQGLAETQSGTATVDVESRAGSARGVLVQYHRYAGADGFGLTEAWPDGSRHAYAGRSVPAAALEVWPAAIR
jgi:uncharacterized protein DUF4178